LKNFFGTSDLTMVGSPVHHNIRGPSSDLDEGKKFSHFYEQKHKFNEVYI